GVVLQDVAKLSAAGEGLGPAEDEVLFPGEVARIDPGQDDAIMLCLTEIGDDVARRAHRAFVNALVDEAIGSETAGQSVFVETAIEDVDMLSTDHAIVTVPARNLAGGATRPVVEVVPPAEENGTLDDARIEDDVPLALPGERDLTGQGAVVDQVDAAG